MGINPISGPGSVQPYYKASEISALTPKKAAERDEGQHLDKACEEIADANPPVKEKEPDTRSKITDFDRVSLTFNKEESFDYIGSESGLADLDVQKAISDMKRDSVLQEYQYFVGSAQTIINPEDGFVFQK